MSNQDFIYTTYIKTTPEKIWDAITNPEFTRQYWSNINVSDWKKGSPWKHFSESTNETRVVGKIVECIPPKLLILTWAEPNDPSDESKVTFEIEPVGEMVRLNVLHGDFKPGSTMLAKISNGWPRVLSSMKSLLETGKPLDTWVCQSHSCSATSAGANA